MPLINMMKRACYSLLQSRFRSSFTRNTCKSGRAKRASTEFCASFLYSDVLVLVATLTMQAASRSREYSRADVTATQKVSAELQDLLLGLDPRIN